MVLMVLTVLRNVAKSMIQWQTCLIMRELEGEVLGLAIIGNLSASIIVQHLDLAVGPSPQKLLSSLQSKVERIPEVSEVCQRSCKRVLSSASGPSSRYDAGTSEDARGTVGPSQKTTRVCDWSRPATVSTAGSMLVHVWRSFPFS